MKEKELKSLDYSTHPFALELKELLKKYNAEITLDNRWDELGRVHEDKIIVVLDVEIGKEDDIISKTEIEIPVDRW